jgi:hypothetical protein
VGILSQPTLHFVFFGRGHVIPYRRRRRRGTGFSPCLDTTLRLPTTDPAILGRCSTENRKTSTLAISAPRTLRLELRRSSPWPPPLQPHDNAHHRRLLPHRPVHLLIPRLIAMLTFLTQHWRLLVGSFEARHHARAFSRSPPPRSSVESRWGV